jgi:hypothetical protein
MMVTDSDNPAEKSNAAVPHDNHAEPNGLWFMLAIVAAPVRHFRFDQQFDEFVASIRVPAGSQVLG